MKNKLAFPVSAYTDPKAGYGQDNGHRMQSGMTLREYYIGQILVSAHQGSSLNNKAIAKKCDIFS